MPELKAIKAPVEIKISAGYKLVNGRARISVKGLVLEVEETEDGRHVITCNVNTTVSLTKVKLITLLEE